MPIRSSSATWQGNLKEGKGNMKLGSGAWEGPFSFSTRFEEEPGTNPEELVAAAHAGCFSMAFSAALEREGFTVKTISTEARAKFEKAESGFKITEMTLNTTVDVDGIEDDKLNEVADGAKKGCPISSSLHPDINVILNLTRA